MRAALVALAVAGCSGSPAARPVASASARPPLDLALAYERGAGMPRDYSKAAEIYAAACADGRGDLAACDRLVRALLDARGVAADRARAGRLALATCKRDDLFGCTVALFMSTRDDLAPEVKAKLGNVDFEAVCARGNAGACMALLAFDFPNFQGSSGVQAKQDHHASLACKAGVLDGCLALIESVNLCGYEAGAERCVDQHVREWTKYQDHDHLDALAAVRASCDRGDAAACSALPGREIPYAQLCDAHDYEACGALGCLGDARAGALAKAHGADANCQAVTNREEAKHAPPPKRRAALAGEPPLPAVAPRPLAPFRSVAFRWLATEPDDWNWPKFEITNLGTKMIIYLRVTAYAYDRTGKQVARSDSQSLGPLMLAPGKSITPDFLVAGLTSVPDEAVAFDVCYDFISFDGETKNAIGGTRDATRCPEQWVRGSGGAALDGSGSLAQASFHAAAKRGIVRYAATDGSPDGASARALGELAAHAIDLAGSDVKPTAPDELAIPVLVSGVGIVYHLQGVTALRLAPATLAKILQRDIKKWNDPAIARDNPGIKLPAEPIAVFRDTSWDEKSDRDVDATRALTAYLAKAARGVWRLGEGSAFAWPADVGRAYGVLDIVGGHEGGISFVELSEGHAKQAAFAAIRNRAGAYVAPSPAALRAAAAGFADQPGPIDAKARDAYPLAYGSWVVVAAKQPDKVRGTLLVEYLHYLVGDGQQLLEGLGLAPLPPALAAKAREAVDHIALPN